MIPNTNPNTGLPYGIVASDSLDPEVSSKLWEMAANACYDAHRNYREAQLLRDATDFIDSLDKVPHNYVMDVINDLVETQLDNEMDEWSADEPHAEVTYKGVTVVVSHLGGAMLVTSLDGPKLQVRSYCSPCCPGAADMDSGYGSILCHGLPIDWFTEEAWAKLTSYDADCPDKDELFCAGFEIQSSSQGYRWSARFWVDDGDYFPTEQEAIDDCVRSNPNIDAQ